MLSFSGSLKIYVALEPCDMRKGFEGLCALVDNQLTGDIKSGALFVFTNQRRNRLKVLYFDGSGLWLMCKRLEKGTFSWPQASQSGQVRMQLSPEAFVMLTDGIDLKAGRPRAWYERS